MAAITTLKEMLNIQAGTLIMGLSIDYSGSVRFCLNGWDVNQRHHIKGLWSSSWATYDSKVYTFSYYEDARVSEMLTKKKLVLHGTSEPTFRKLQKNGRTYREDVSQWIKKVDLTVKECVGMSLGESFLTAQPTHTGNFVTVIPHAGIYRPDFYEVLLFHKILHGNSIKWIMLRSRAINKKNLVSNAQALLLDIVVELA